jgi:hypothetical protein
MFDLCARRYQTPLQKPYQQDELAGCVTKKRKKNATEATKQDRTTKEVCMRRVTTHTI